MILNSVFIVVFFFNATPRTESYTELRVGRVRCVYKTDMFPPHAAYADIRFAGKGTWAGNLLKYGHRYIERDKYIYIYIYV